MRVIGKITGGGIGFMLGGPFGALAGVALGHQLFDQPPREFFGVPMSETEIRNSVFFTATFSMLGKLAKADGRVSDEELVALRTIIRDQLGLSRRSRDYAMRTFEAAIASDDSFEIHVRAFHSQFADAPEALANMIEIMLILAHADFEYDDSEETLIRHAADVFGIASQYDGILRLFRSEPDNLEHCYEYLGCEPGDDLAVIRQQYERLLKEHDPELLLKEGVPRELIKVSSDKHRKIKLAFDQITLALEESANA